MPAALEGIKVLDLTRTLAGPFCTMQLADMGAEVTKVEEPAKGDECREWPPFWNGISCYYLAINRNKRSIALNLKRPEAVEVIKRLAARSDVMIESFRTGAADFMGIGYEAIKAVNHRIIYCGISGYGRTGPLKDKPGYDPMVQAYGGLMSITGEPGRPPVRAGYSLVDIICGWMAYGAILTALYQREGTGHGQYVEASLLEGQVASSTFHTVSYLGTGRVPKRLGSSNPSVHPFQAYATKDGHILLGVGNDGLWQRFCKATKRPDLLEDARFKTNPLRVEHREEVNSILEGLVSQKTTKEWAELLDKAGVPNSPINDIPSLVQDPQVCFRSMIVKVPHPDIPNLEMPGSPLRLSDSPATVRRHPPRLGEHTVEVLHEMGYSDGDIEQMGAVGAIGP